MPITDDELDRIVRNFKRAFEEVVTRYERESTRYGAGDVDAKRIAQEMSVIAVPYLEAAREQAERARRAEDEQALKLPQTLRPAAGTP